MSLSYTDSSSNSWYIDSYGRIQVSKDSQSLYGFLDSNEKKLFV